MNSPVWIDEKGKIIEPEYCRDFLSRHPMRCINDRFYTVEGPLPDESKLKRTIYEEISPWLHAKVAQTVEQVLKTLKLAAYADPLPLQCDRIHVANGTYFLDGTFTEKKEYCSNRLSVPYRADAPAPEQWLHFLSELLEPEDIPALQEYLGYCLIPSTKGQKMLMLIGKGGEGKSRIGVVMNAIFGLNMNTTSIQKSLQIKSQQGIEENLQMPEEAKKGQDKKTAAQAPVKLKMYGSGQSAFSSAARYSFTRP